MGSTESSNRESLLNANMLPGRLSQAESGLSREQKVTIYQWLWSCRQSHSSTKSQQVTELTLSVEFGKRQTPQVVGSGWEAEWHSSILKERAEEKMLTPFPPEHGLLCHGYLVPWITRLKRFKSLALRKQNRKGCQLIR